MTPKAPTPTHQAVQDFYGKIARENGSCCDPSGRGIKAQNILYPAELLSTLPADITNFSEGSGDPVSLAKLKPGETVLDLGSGAGLDCFLASKQVGPNGHVIGVDMTPDMLQRARSNAERLEVTNVEFREGFLESLPVEDASIDVILSNCVINLSPDKPQVLREMARVLKPGGRIAISDMVSNHPLPEKGEANEDWCGCTSGALTDQAFTRELTLAGFTDIQVVADIEKVQKAVASGQVKLPQGSRQEQLLDDLQKWDQCQKTMVVPHKITARKPL